MLILVVRRLELYMCRLIHWILVAERVHAVACSAIADARRLQKSFARQTGEVLIAPISVRLTAQIRAI